MTDPYTRPRPNPEPEATQYWDSLREHAIAVQRCRTCQTHYFPPSTHCPSCLSDDVEWTTVSGKGRVWSHVTMHRAYRPDYKGDVPYNVSIVELDEGPKLWTNVVGMDPAEITIGLPVEVRYDDVAEDLTLARFVPAARNN